MDAPLHSQRGPGPSRLTIGYGAGGGDSLKLTVKAGELSDTGFFKLFVFPKYVDMDWLAQGPAFEASDTRKVERGSKRVDVWGAWIAAVTVSEADASKL